MRKLAIIAAFPLFVMAVRFLPLNRLPSTCVFYHVTGCPCPTCGMTRATIAVTHLEFGRAMSFHPLAVLFMGVIAVLWGVAVYETATGRKTAVLLWTRHHALKLVLAAFGLLLVFGVFRIATRVWP